MYFVTGGTGFIGKNLIDQLLKNKEVIYVLVLEHHKEHFDLLQNNRWIRYADKVKLVIGDILEPNFGLSKETIKELKENVKHFYHLAAMYDLKANMNVCKKHNVTGTENAVNLANQLNVTFHYMSSIVIGGGYDGVFKESMLKEGQNLTNPYAITKYEAEVSLREKIKVPFRVYRPGIVIGSAENGEAEKIDGPYYGFNFIKGIGKIFPRWTPLLGLQGGYWYLVPVDYVAKAVDHISHKKGLDGKTFHLIGRGMKVIDVINEFCRVAHAPQFKSQISPNVLNSAPFELLKKIPFTQFAMQQAMDRLDLPDSIMDFFKWDTKFDNSQTIKALKGSGISCPKLQDYSRIVWYFWEAHMEPILSHKRKDAGMTKALIETPEVITGGRSLSQLVKERLDMNINAKREIMAKMLKGKTTMITGGSSGIGLAMAHLLAKANGKVILVARSIDKLEIAKKEVEQLGGEAYIYSCDLTSPDAIGDLVNEVIKDHGKVDILINNAGRSIRRPIHKAYDRFHDFQRTMDLNYFGCLKLILGLLPEMRKNKFGHIINISSIGCQTNVPRFSAYVASKSALDAFSRSISAEVVHDNITLTTVYMPLVRTPMIAPTKMYDNIPTLTPEQAAKLALSPLLSKKSKVSTPLGTFAEFLHAVSPKTASVILNLGFRLFPDAASQDKKLSAETIAFAYLSKGIHW